MKMKTYQADTMQEALNLVKDEMGPDAVILKSRRATRKVGAKTQACFEVTAALEESLANRAQPAHPEPPPPAQAIPRPMAGRIPPANQYDWRGTLRRVSSDEAQTAESAPSTRRTQGSERAESIPSAHKATRGEEP